MHHGCKTVSMEIGDDDVIDDIINSTSIATIWTAVTWLILKLERRTNKPTCGELDWLSRCCTNFKIFSIITVVIIILRVIIILEILASTQSPIAFSSVCLSVYLSVRMNVVSRIQVAPLDQSSPNLTQMCILVIARNLFIIWVKGRIVRSRGKK